MDPPTRSASQNLQAPNATFQKVNELPQTPRQDLRESAAKESLARFGISRLALVLLGRAPWLVVVQLTIHKQLPGLQE